MTIKKMRTLQPPPPSDSFTIEEAIAAWAKVEADEKARRASKRKRSRAASAKTSKARGKIAGGG